MKYRLGDLTVKNWNDWDRVPRMPQAIAAAVTGFASLSAAAAAGSAFAYAAVYVGSYIAVTAVTSWALSALAPKPDFSSFGSQGTLVNAREAAAAADFVYGEVRKGGTVVFYESTGEENKYLHQVIALAGHEVNAIGDIYINDEVVSWDASTGLVSGDWDNKIRIRKHLGDQTTADADLVNETSAGATFVGNGIAHLYVRYEYDRDVFANGLPLVTAKIQGKKVYDPRSDTTAYSNNAALCMRDFIVSEYGLNDSAIDDVSFSVAANESDEDITLAAGGTEKRYTINGIVKASSPIGKVLGDMSTACAGTLFWGSGYWKLKVGAYSSPVKTLTLDDLRGPISMKTRTSMRDSFNGVTGTFNDAVQDFITADYPPIQSDTFKAEDGGDELPLDLPLPFTTSASAAQRLAKLTLYRAREQISITADFGLNAFDIEVGDIIAFDNERYGFDGKEFEVMGWRFESNQDAGDLRVSLTLQETSAAAFDWNAEETAIIANNTSLYDFRDVPSVQLNLYSTSIVSNQELINILNIVTYTSRPSEVDYVEVQYRLATDPDYGSSTTSDLGITQVRGLEARSEYAVRARSVNALGIRGSWTEATTYINPVSFDLTELAELSAELVNDSLHFNWSEINDPSLSHFRVRYSPVTDGSALWSDATTDIVKISRPATTTATPARAGTYMVKAFSKTGQQAPIPSQFVISADEIPATFANTLTIDDSAFSGTLVNTAVNSGRLEIDGTNVISNGTFNLDYWVGWNTTGGWYRTGSFAQASLRDLPDRGYVRLPKMVQTTSFSDDTVPIVWQYVSDGAGTWSFYHEQLPYLNPLQRPLPNLPPEGYFTVSLGDAENINLPMKVGQHSIQFETTAGSGAFEFFRDLEVYAYPNSPFEMLLTDMELVKGPHEYYFSNSVNLGSVKFCKITAEVLTERRGEAAGVWDGIQGPWDEWVGFFDDWTGDAQPDDTDVELWFRKSDDNSTWSDWRKFRSSVIKTRYIQFKAVLKSRRPNKVTPSIETLKVNVEHQ